MSWFVWRRDHEDLKRQLAEREAELRHILDLMWKQGFGVTLFEKTPPQSQLEEVAQPEQPTPVEQSLTPEEEMEIENQRELDRLTSIRRTNPSRLGAEMTATMARKAARMAKAAHPQHRSPKVAEVFERARKEVS